MYSKLSFTIKCTSLHQIEQIGKQSQFVTHGDIFSSPSIHMNSEKIKGDMVIHTSIQLAPYFITLGHQSLPDLN